jgi:Holliday junction resolvasome RuvABC endonuclease subunit
LSPAPLILGIDPSLTGTGYALARGRELLDAGVCRPRGADKATLYERIREIVSDLDDEVARLANANGWIDAVAIEFPQPRTIGGRSGTASYAMVVGAVLCGIKWRSSEVLTPTASEWTRGFPGTAGDKNKTKRIALVERTFRVKLAKGSGDAADAALLTVWAASQLGHNVVIG